MHTVCIRDEGSCNHGPTGRLMGSGPQLRSMWLQAGDNSQKDNGEGGHRVNDMQLYHMNVQTMSERMEEKRCSVVRGGSAHPTSPNYNFIYKKEKKKNETQTGIWFHKHGPGN